jgi:MinD-like ATPase involved in chromosome partitioning or flagellar assembly
VAVIGLAGGKGSPGVTTAALALALAWPLNTDTDTGAQRDGGAARRVVVVEADAAGSSVRAGYLRGRVDPELGMSALVDADPHDIGALVRQHVVPIEDRPDRYLLPGLASPQHLTAHREDLPGVAQWLRALDRPGHRTDVVLDVGRVGARAEPAALIRAADAMLVVCRTDLPSVMSALHAVTYLQITYDMDPDALGCLLVGERQPYSRAEVEASLELPVLGVLARDPSSAWVFSHGGDPGRGFHRARLLRSALPVARVIASWAAGDQTTVTAR